MFPYRRQGPKKRSKNGPNRRPRGPQKPLPNSARELLPLIQPATKALAQVLAGRASASGQFGHAQAVAAQAERLIAERAHNRLNPAEREEFFEQLARLKLTLVDAELEAGVQADEEEAKPAPRPPVAQERLKQMALALTTPDPGRAEVKPDANGEKEAEQEDAAPRPGQAHDARRPGDEEAEEALNEPRPESRSIGNAQSGRLQLSRSAAERAASAVAIAPATRARPARTARRSRAEPAETPAEPGDEAGEQAREVVGRGGGAPETPSEPRPGEAAAGNGQRSAQRARRATQKGVPEGWVIDDEGYVVPGP